MPYIEVKTIGNIYKGLAKSIASKGTIKVVLTTGKISDTAKRIFEENNIEWVENIPESEFSNIKEES
ncbi:MAG: hypothetical protein H7A25_12910 [Leptospiraceae bacterium]|nr:hypothetical protein [Leptospiraceae bacterium]MCP5500800.1 hypothetical protein [Leptospiraceae bacterium]